jgi:hypothetical protein
MPVISAVGSQNQEDHEFEANLGYRESFRLNYKVRPFLGKTILK